MKNLGLKKKLISAFLAASAVPLLVIGFYAYFQASSSLQEQALSKLEGIRNSKKVALETYMDTFKKQVTDASRSAIIEEAITKFSEGFKSYKTDVKATPAMIAETRAEVLKYYSSSFSAMYAKKNEGKSPDLSSYVNTLSDSQILLQKRYIIDSEIGGPEKYGQTHEKFNDDLTRFVELFGYYDVLLIDADGNVVYSAYKEIDFGANLNSTDSTVGPLKKFFQATMALSDASAVYLSDYESYIPSYSEPAMFIGAPIIRNGVKLGVIAYQVPTDVFSKLMTLKITHDKTLETFIVGSDFLPRTDTLNDPNRKVSAAYRYPEKGRINNQDIQDALSGKQVLLSGKDYIGRDALISAGPLDFYGNKWVIKSVITMDEALLPIYNLRRALIIGLVLTVVLVVVAASYWANGLANRFNKLTDLLISGAKVFGVKSSQIAEISTRLSEASTQQAASLQETVSSVDEISAIVQRNADAARSSLKATEKSNVSAQNGKHRVEHMLDSIKQISAQNDNIAQSVAQSNAEISEIVKVIREISDKTKVINDIVFQTKLLSFNASVEAARAGEHGKGFAVVAEEVGNLASMSGKAANEITEMLDRSVVKVNAIVDSTKKMMEDLMRTSKDKVEVGSKAASECAHALDEILASVSTVNELVAEITTASQEQSAGIREITKAMAELDQVTQSNSAIAGESSYAGQEIKTQAETIRSSIDELSVMVNGFQHRDVSAPVEHSNVHHLTPQKSSASKPKKSQSLSQPTKVVTKEYKKVSGDSASVPSANDDRFEDV